MSGLVDAGLANPGMRGFETYGAIPTWPRTVHVVAITDHALIVVILATADSAATADTEYMQEDMSSPTPLLSHTL